MKRKAFSFLLLMLIVLSPIRVRADVITPYEDIGQPDEFFNGATFVLQNTNDYQQWLTAELERANGVYNINTITVYGLEGFDDAYKTHLFSELQRLNMRICVRIESYDPESFAFTPQDAATVIERHRSLIEFVCLPENRGALEYFALNMPVDDGAVQENLGGVNSETSKRNQATYASEIVRGMRALCTQNGFDSAKMYLSVFFGWDNSYDVPSYAGAGADGYFINNYAYPKGNRIPDAQTAPEDIINAERLSEAMEIYKRLYPAHPPVIIECGFHTLEYNNGVRPSQTAGLVADRATKAIAVKTVVKFYKENYPFVKGLLYFGYNLFNQEGNPPMDMDWALSYPTLAYNEAEDATLTGAAAVVERAGVSGLRVIVLAQSDGAVFTQVPPTQQITVTYRAAIASELTISSGGRERKTVTLNATDGFVTFGIPLSLVEGYDMELACVSGEIELDAVAFYEKLEAEYAQMQGGASASALAEASNGMAAEGMKDTENALIFSGTRGGETMLIVYRATQDTELILETGGNAYRLPLAASEAFTEVEAELPLAQNADFKLYESGNDVLILDSLTLAGAPAPQQVSSPQQDTNSPAPITPERTDAPDTQEDGEPAWLIVVAVTGFALTAILLVRLFMLKKRKGN